MLRWTHDHHRDLRALESAPRATALHSTNRETFAVTRHGLPQFPPAAPPLRPTLEFAPSVVSDAPKLPLAGTSPPATPPMPATIRTDRITSRASPPPVVTSPRSAENRNTHRPSSAARGFVPRRLSARAGGTKLMRPYWLGLLSEAPGTAGDPDAALAAVTEGLGTIEETGERWWEAELHRLRAMLLIARRDMQEAEVRCGARSSGTLASGEIAGIARGNQPCGTVGRARQAGRSPGAAGTDLRLVQ